jgi:hypothetical protein
VEAPALQVLEEILARHVRRLGATNLIEVLVRWSGLTDSLATWENVQVLKRCFPNAPAWGQAGSEEEGDVMDPVIRLKRIYNFLCSMIVYTPFALCFVTLCGVFMHFPELTY